MPAGRFLLPAIVLYGLVFVVPFIGSLPLSFSSWNGIGRFTFDGLSNFAHVVTNASFLAALRHNAIMVGAFFILTNAVGLGLGAPGGATDVVGTLIYRTAFGTGIFSSTANLGFSEANAVGVMVILAIGMVLLQLYFRRRIVEL